MAASVNAPAVSPCPCLLGRESFSLGQMDDNNFFKHPDLLSKSCKGNESVKEVVIDPYCYDPGNEGGRFASYEVWEALGEAIGQLKSLEGISIAPMDPEHEVDRLTSSDFSPDWETLNCILRHVRHKKIGLDLNSLIYTSESYDPEGFARLIRLHHCINFFSTANYFHHADFCAVLSALESLPILAEILLSLDGHSADDQTSAAITALMMSPSLRVAEFEGYITTTSCRGIGQALRNGSPVTHLEFNGCMFPDEDGGVEIVQALRRNMSVREVRFMNSDIGESIYDAMTAVLVVNKTLKDVQLCSRSGGGTCLESLFRVVANINRTLETLHVGKAVPGDERVYHALCEMLTNNKVLEKLVFECEGPLLTTDLALWRTTLSCLGVNATLMDLKFQFHSEREATNVVRFANIVLAALDGNNTLETLEIQSSGISTLSSSQFLSVLEKVPRNTSLTSLRLGRLPGALCEKEEEKQRLVELVEKNYRLEDLGSAVTELNVAQVDAILRLNQAGRIYMLHATPLLSEGVEVLTNVRDDLDCLLVHLLENPMLCAAARKRDTTRNSLKRKKPQSR